MRAPDLAAAVNDGTLGVRYALTRVEPGQPLPGGGYEPERITVADGGAPRVRHLAADLVHGRMLDEQDRVIRADG